MIPRYPGLRLGILQYFSRHMEEVDKIPCLFALNSWYLGSFTTAIVDAAAYSLQVLQIIPSRPHAMPWPSDDCCL